MTEPEERAGWPMHTGFVGDADATACATYGADRSMSEPEECAGWRMHACFVGNADADEEVSSAGAFGNAGAEVGKETTTALRFGWGV
jgi:hypothetical protein